MFKPCESHLIKITSKWLYYRDTSLTCENSKIYDSKVYILKVYCKKKKNTVFQSKETCTGTRDLKWLSMSAVYNYFSSQ